MFLSGSSGKAGCMKLLLLLLLLLLLWLFVVLLNFGMCSCGWISVAGETGYEFLFCLIGEDRLAGSDERDTPEVEATDFFLE